MVRSRNQSRCFPEILFGLCPPIWPGATLPVSREAPYPMAVLKPTRMTLLYAAHSLALIALRSLIQGVAVTHHLSLQR